MPVQPLVSIIIPICNKEAYLRRTLNSLISQTLHNIEILCIDDHSTDLSREIIREYAARDSRIVPIYHNTNLGTSRSRKDGVLASHGQYIMFLDGDDQFKLHACEVAYNAINKAQSDILQFNIDIKNCSGVPEERIAMNKKLFAPCLEKIEGDLVQECWRNRKFGFQITNKIFRNKLAKKAFAEIEDTKILRAEDLYAFFVIAYYAHTYVGISEDLYEYNFGLGQTGQEQMTITQFRPFLTEKSVSVALKRFTAVKGIDEIYADILHQIDSHFIAECSDRWCDSVCESDRIIAFNELVNTFGLEDVITHFAQTEWWNPQNRLLEKVHGLKQFQYTPRHHDKTLTIAMYYRNIVNGGAQRVAAMLCNIWANLRDKVGHSMYKVVLITDEGKLENEYPLSDKVERAYLPAWEKSRQGNFRARYRAWQSVIECYSIDIIVHGLWVADTTWWDMLAIKGAPSHPAYVCHSHNFCCVPFDFGDNRPLELMYRYMMSDGIVTLSECDQEYVATFNSNVRTITNPVAFNPSKHVNSTYENNNIVWVGRLSSEKNPLDVIKMAECVRLQLPDVQLFIVGDGDKHIKTQMQRYIMQHKLEENVHMTGFKLNTNDYYHKASAFITTSTYEGFSLTIAEALSFGVPVISYDMPWLPFIRDGRGIITVPQRKYKMLANEVVKLLSHPEKVRELGNQGKQLIKEIASADIAGEWSKLFKAVNNSRNKCKQTPLSNTENILKYMTLYQHTGRYKAIDKVRRELSVNESTHIYEIEQLKHEMTLLRQQIAAYRNSNSWRIGRLITWLPRKIKGGIKCCQDHGLRYTLRHATKKVYRRC